MHTKSTKQSFVVLWMQKPIIKSIFPGNLANGSIHSTISAPEPLHPPRHLQTVQVRTGKLSSGPFCTEFRCESNSGVGFSIQKLFEKVKNKKVHRNSRRVRAGMLSTGPFFIEFGYKSNCADGVSPNPLF